MSGALIQCQEYLRKTEGKHKEEKEGTKPRKMSLEEWHGNPEDGEHLTPTTLGRRGATTDNDEVRDLATREVTKHVRGRGDGVAAEDDR